MREAWPCFWQRLWWPHCFCVPPRQGLMGVHCVFSREPVAAPQFDAGDACEAGSDSPSTDGSLNCHGYGSTVMVTASFGLVAAAQVVERLVVASGPLGAARAGTRSPPR